MPDKASRGFIDFRYIFKSRASVGISAIDEIEPWRAILRSLIGSQVFSGWCLSSVIGLRQFGVARVLEGGLLGALVLWAGGLGWAWPVFFLGRGFVVLIRGWFGWLLGRWFGGFSASRVGSQAGFVAGFSAN